MALFTTVIKVKERCININEHTHFYTPPRQSQGSTNLKCIATKGVIREVRRAQKFTLFSSFNNYLKGGYFTK